MTQTAFKGAAGAFQFYEHADDAIKTYLTTLAGNVSTYLLATVTFRAHRPETEPAGESKGRFPLAYIWTSGTTGEPKETNSIHVDCTTRITVWAHHLDQATAAKNCQAAAGAILSALVQAPYVSGGDFRAFYSNFDIAHPSLEAYEVNPVTDSSAWVASQVITVTWAHWELAT